MDVGQVGRMIRGDQRFAQIEGYLGSARDGFVIAQRVREYAEVDRCKPWSKPKNGIIPLLLFVIDFLFILWFSGLLCFMVLDRVVDVAENTRNTVLIRYI